MYLAKLRVDKIYPNQIKAGNEIFDFLKNQGKKPVIACAQMQSGKTLSVIWGLNRYIEYLGGSEKCDLLWLGPSDTNLRDQTHGAICNIYENEHSNSRVDFTKVENSLLNKKVYHAPSIKKSSKTSQEIISSLTLGKAKNKTTLVVLDEGHIGIGAKQTVPKFLEEHLGLPGISDLLNNCNFVIVTATPGAFLDYEKKSLISKFSMVYVQPGNGYLSLKKLKEDNRLNGSFSIEDEDSKTRWYNDVFIPFISKPPSYGITRIKGQGDEHVSYIESLKNNHNFLVKKYNCFRKNIKELSTDLKVKPDKHIICLITDSYMQGSTLKVENVGFWFDRCSSSTTTETNTAQSVGRNCGYERDNLHYPVWTDLDHVDTAIRFFDCAEVSDWDGAMNANLTSAHLQNKAEKSEVEIIAFSSLDELNNDIFIQNKKFKKTTRSVKLNTKNNIADDILKKNARNMAPDEDGQIVYVDGPNAEHVNSYNELLNAKPEYIGKYLFIYKTGNIIKEKINTSFLQEPN